MVLPPRDVTDLHELLQTGTTGNIQVQSARTKTAAAFIWQPV